jgi:hypothetical protein
MPSSGARQYPSTLTETIRECIPFEICSAVVNLESGYFTVLLKFPVTLRAASDRKLLNWGRWNPWNQGGGGSASAAAAASAGGASASAGAGGNMIVLFHLVPCTTQVLL